MSCNTAPIRELLKAVFDDQDLTIFCYDNFRPVYDRFASEMSRLWKIQLLIDYCEKYDRFNELLTQVREINAEQYVKFISLIKGPSQTSGVSLSTSKSQVEITLKGDLPNFTPELQSAAIGALAGVLNIPRDQISVSRIQAGSIILELEMPTATVNQLIALFEANNPILEDLGIQHVRAIQRQISQRESIKNQVEILTGHPLAELVNVNQLVSTLANKLEVFRDQLRLLEVQGGTIRLEMPAAAVNQLIALNRVNEQQLQDLGIQQVRVIPEQETTTNLVEILVKHSEAIMVNGDQLASTLATDILDLSRDQLKLLEVQGGTVRLEMPTHAIKKLIRLHVSKDYRLKTAGIEQVKLLLKFRDREQTRSAILGSDARHIELYGPGGVGKTYLLHHITQGFEDVRSVYINLETCTGSAEIMAEVMRQLTGVQPATPVKHADFARAVEKLHKPGSGPGYNHFVFLFDAARDEENHREVIKWLIGENGLINDNKFLLFLERLQILDDVKLQVVIATRKPMVQTQQEDYHDNFLFAPIGIDHLTRKPIPKEDAVNLMLWELADYYEQRIPKKLQQDIISNLYYITGGHPRCIQSVLFALADIKFLPTENDWKEFFNQYVLPTIEQEMLVQIPSELRSTFEILSVFRCFDKQILITLIERQKISGLPVGQTTADQASNLRNRLVETSLVNEPDKKETMYTMNFTIRRVLELDMVYNNPARYQEINEIALEIFTERLEHPERLSDKERSVGRFIHSYIEIIYHFLKVLEADPSVNRKIVCAKTAEKLKTSLPLLLNAIDSSDLPRLRSFFLEDQELQEIIERISGDSACYQNLLRHI